MNSAWDEIRVNPVSRCLTKLHTHELESVTLHVWETVSEQINVIQHEIMFTTKSSVHDYENDLI
jgi:hypothetical protein